MSDAITIDPKQIELFTQLWTGSQSKIYALLLSLVQDREAARDLMQDVSVVLWKKFDQYEEGSNFTAWAATVSRYHVLNWRRKNSRRGIPLTDRALELIGTEAEEFAEDYEIRAEALRACLTKLPERQRAILAARYTKRLAAPEIANDNGVAVRTVYKMLTRVHSTLAACINQRLTAVQP